MTTKPSFKATISDVLGRRDLFGQWFAPDSWASWRAVLKAAFGEPLSATEEELFTAVAGRQAPSTPVRELWCVAGRRAGKDSIAATVATYVAVFGQFSSFLRPGERATIVCLATDRAQARLAFRYVRGNFAAIPALEAMITRETEDTIELSNRAEIVIGTNDFRLVRGRTIVCAIYDEVAYWRSENAANPDFELDNAVTPSLATIPGSIKIGISSPYRKSGLLYAKWKKHFGKDGDILVIRAPSRKLNPTLPQHIVDDAMEADPEAAAAEWLAEWRNDLSAFIDRRVVEQCVVPGRFELPPISTIRYTAFCDPSGGSADSFTMCIAHMENNVVVIDCVREQKPPFSPEQVIANFATLMSSYHVSKVYGDRYGGEFPKELFRNKGVTYELSDRPASDIYRDVLAKLNSGGVELLDNGRIINQFVALERRVGRTGRDTISHPVGGHDDVANSVAGAILMASSARGPIVISAADIAWSKIPNPRRSHFGLIKPGR